MISSDIQTEVELTDEEGETFLVLVTWDLNYGTPHATWGYWGGEPAEAPFAESIRVTKDGQPYEPTKGDWLTINSVLSKEIRETD